MTVSDIPQIEGNNKHISSRQTGLCHYENKAQNCVGLQWGYEESWKRMLERRVWDWLPAGANR